MKAQLFITAAILCTVLFCTTVHAQKLEQVLPTAIQKQLPEMQANVNFLLNKVSTVNPGFKNSQQLMPQFNTALDELRKQKPGFANVKLPAVTPASYDQLIATKTKELGAQSGVVKILTAFKEGLAKAGDNTDVVNTMVMLIKSPAFETMGATDKTAFYYAFAAAKTAGDYGAKNNLFAAVENTATKPGVGGFAGGGYDDDYYMAKGAMCHWLCTMAGALAGGYVGAEGGAVAGAAIGFGIGANACY